VPEPAAPPAPARPVLPAAPPKPATAVPPAPPAPAVPAAPPAPATPMLPATPATPAVPAAPAPPRPPAPPSPEVPPAPPPPVPVAVDPGPPQATTTSAQLANHTRPPRTGSHTFLTGCQNSSGLSPAQPHTRVLVTRCTHPDPFFLVAVGIGKTELELRRSLRTSSVCRRRMHLTYRPDAARNGCGMVVRRADFSHAHPQIAAICAPLPGPDAAAPRAPSARRRGGSPSRL